MIPIGSNILTDAPAGSEQYRSQAGADPDEALVVYFGLVNRSKGLETLLDAFRRILDRGLRARLALVGAVAGDSDATNQAYLAEIDRLIAQHRLGPFVHRTGYLGERDVAGYLTAADVVALPFADGASYRRGSLMAALRLGCAIVTTTPAVEVTTFQDGENMMLILAGDGPALADALHKVIVDPALRARLRAGSARLSSAFEWPQIAQATIEVFDRATRSGA
ncbi:MAG: glycosyltransferase [Chloroflexi bacterium]|nr:glycosyltransferase [Chloroflexota bacterium]